MDMDSYMDMNLVPLIGPNRNENCASDSARRTESGKPTKNPWGNHFCTNRGYGGSPFGLADGNPRTILETQMTLKSRFTVTQKCCKNQRNRCKIVQKTNSEKLATSTFQNPKSRK